MSVLTPPASKEHLQAFLNLTGAALGCRSDADMARTMGMLPSAVANWRRRGVVSAKGVEWFQTRLIQSIFYVSPDLPPLSDTGANAAVIDLIAKTNGNPIDASENVRLANAVSLPGLVALAQLFAALALLNGYSAKGAEEADWWGLLEEAMPMFRASPALQGFTS
ncbi:hypothetical protein [Sphingomonas sp.]|uniref:hypothetical protein n=1 Tax=Sphingomonas sp. TaxID=28214 RepID=UPI002DD6938A|nr:hypothetical protein [Sphingomonas sp.]